MAGLFDSNGPLDTVSASILLFFSTVWFLGFGLQIKVVVNLMPDFLTFFGMFPAPLQFSSSDLAVRGGGAFALVPVLQIIPFFLGTENRLDGGRQHRQQVALAIWLGFFLINFQNSVMEGNLGGWQTTFNLNWLVTNGFFTLLHLHWVGQNIGKKLKIL